LGLSSDPASQPRRLAQQRVRSRQPVMVVAGCLPMLFKDPPALANAESRFSGLETPGARKRNAALGILSAASRCATRIETLAVMPGLSFDSRLVTAMIVG